jgi:hypothetical protein
MLLNLAIMGRLRQKGPVQDEGHTSGTRLGLQAWGCWTPRPLVLSLACAIVLAASLCPTRAGGPAGASLLKAAQTGNPALVKAAIAEGANVNCEGTNGLSPLLESLHGISAPVDDSRRECVVLLLKSAANVDALDGDGRTALIYAVRAGDMETVRLLVDAGAFIKRRDAFHKTAVLYAAECGRRDILIYLGRTLKVQYKQSAW